MNISQTNNTNFFKNSLYIDKQTIFLVMKIFVTSLLFLNFISFTIFYSIIDKNNLNHSYTYLAESFLHGQFNFYQMPPSSSDIIQWNNNYYWHLPPLPAVLLMPQVSIFGPAVGMGAIQLLIIATIFITCYFIAKKYLFSKINSWWLAFAFIYASIFQAVAFVADDWRIGNALGTLFSLLAIYTYLHNKKLWLTGFFTALAFLTRMEAGFIILLFSFDLIFDSNIYFKDKCKKLSLLLLPLLIAGVLMGLYNHARFGNALTTGYEFNQIADDQQITAREKYGLFSPKLIPSNFYHYFLSSFEPIIDPSTNHLIYPYIKLGSSTSFFLISPIFLLIFGIRNKNRFMWSSVATTIIMTFILLSYFSIMKYELGPRYMISVMPLLFILLLEALKNKSLSYLHYSLITISSLLNYYLILSIT